MIAQTARSAAGPPQARGGEQYQRRWMFARRALSARFAAFGGLVVLAVVLGVWPNLLLSWMEPSVTGLVDMLARGGP